MIPHPMTYQCLIIFKNDQNYNKLIQWNDLNRDMLQKLVKIICYIPMKSILNSKLIIFLKAYIVIRKKNFNKKIIEIKVFFYLFFQCLI